MLVDFETVLHFVRFHSCSWNNLLSSISTHFWKSWATLFFFNAMAFFTELTNLSIYQTLEAFLLKVCGNSSCGALFHFFVRELFHFSWLHSKKNCIAFVKKHTQLLYYEFLYSFSLVQMVWTWFQNRNHPIMYPLAIRGWKMVVELSSSTLPLSSPKIIHKSRNLTSPRNSICVTNLPPIFLLLC